MKEKHHRFLWPALAVLFLDQISKWLILKSLPVHQSITVIQGFFNLVHVRNRGMAFGFMNRMDVTAVSYILVGLSIGAVVFLAIWFYRLETRDRYTLVGLSLILGGAFGNLVDRLRFQEVIDFLDFYVGTYHWPAFNMADSAITVGTFWVAVRLLRQRTVSDSGT